MRRTLPDIETFVQGIRAANRALLGQAITLVESTREDRQAMARDIIARLHADLPDNTFRIAVTGAPGAGKSTFIEALGMHLVAQGKRVAVLAIDPSSAMSGGSILGDKTRMEQLSATEMAFIRPSPSGDSLGGVARKTREAMVLVEAAGFDTVIVETVGVGQSEIAAQRMTDLFLLLLLPGAGDELQGIKRGIVEMADLLVVNKSDGDRVKLANQARAHYLNATHLLPLKPSGWPPEVLACSALENTGIDAVWQRMEAYQAHTRANGWLLENRRQQARYWLEDTLDAGLKDLFYQHPEVKARLAALEPEVLSGKVSAIDAAMQVLAAFRKGM
ncbi:MAG TPA: methylmalonyl Co-A mutase-associated GTPase MeaB [Saprospiraceae bacterium]|nr:methylmalonyl Co-A mutase-associated GTPase MeaB [Saprospiraceae bacterium]